MSRTFEEAVSGLEFALERYVEETDGKARSQKAHDIAHGVATLQSLIEDWRVGS